MKRSPFSLWLGVNLSYIRILLQIILHLWVVHSASIKKPGWAFLGGFPQLRSAGSLVFLFIAHLAPWLQLTWSHLYPDADWGPFLVSETMEILFLHVSSLLSQLHPVNWVCWGFGQEGDIVIIKIQQQTAENMTSSHYLAGGFVSRDRWTGRFILWPPLGRVDQTHGTEGTLAVIYQQESFSYSGDFRKEKLEQSREVLPDPSHPLALASTFCL